MARFKNDNIIKLKEFLYNNCIHDSKLKIIKYNYIDNILEIEAFNPIVNVAFNFLFCNVETLFATKGNWLYGNKEEISSLTIEENFLYLQNYISKYDKDNKEFLYLVFQTFSGDELHIVCKEVTIEKTFN